MHTDMHDTTIDGHAPGSGTIAATNFKELLVRISRAQAETDRFAAEQRRLSQETLKLKVLTLQPDRGLVLILLATGLLSGGVVVVVLWGLQHVATIIALAHGTSCG